MFFHFPLSKIYEKTGRLVTCPFSYAPVKTAPSGNPEGAAFCRMGKLLGVVDAVHMTDEVENLVGVADLVVYSWVPCVAQKMLELSKLFNDKSHSFVNLITPTNRWIPFHRKCFLIVEPQTVAKY